MGASNSPSNGHKRSPGNRAGPNVVRIGYTRELGKPYRLSPPLRRVGSREVDNGLEGKGTRKKQKHVCNRRDRSSKFALIRKDADFRMWWFMVKTATNSNERSKPNNFLEEWATTDSKDRGKQWNNIPWKYVIRRVSKLQSRITKATIEGNLNLVKKLQYLLSQSFAAKLLAVRQVTSNKGKRTSGVDKQLWRTPPSKMKAALTLTTKNYKAKPLKRTYIAKKGKNKKRPLGIPTMYDRAMQALHAMSLDPVAEATADKASFGFRKKRGLRDAEAHIFRCLNRPTSAQWVLEGDIKGCFDNINHQWLMENIPMDKKILKQFLKAGFIYKRKLFPTERGTPQGGIVSPIMANMTLDGIEGLLRSRYWKSKQGTIHSRNNKNHVNYTRYADDFIITAQAKETLLEIKELLSEHLRERGLYLSEEKTLITHIDDGFDFLGWTFRRFKGKLITKPSKSSFKRITDKLKAIVGYYLASSQSRLIRSLNPVITGWSNNHRTVHAKETYAKLDHALFWMLWAWALHRHPNKSKRWIKDRYWKTERNRTWLFSDGHITLKLATDTKIIRHRLIKFDANPYLLSDRDYYRHRDEKRKQGKFKAAADNGRLMNCLSGVT